MASQALFNILENLAVLADACGESEQETAGFVAGYLRKDYDFIGTNYPPHPPARAALTAGLFCFYLPS